MSNPTFAPNESLRDSGGKLIYGSVVRNVLLQQAVTVGATAVALPTTALSKRLAICIYNNSASKIYIGASDVTTSNGYPILPNGQFVQPIDDNITIYAISADAECDVRVMEGG